MAYLDRYPSKKAANRRTTKNEVGCWETCGKQVVIEIASSGRRAILGVSRDTWRN